MSKDRFFGVGINAYHKSPLDGCIADMTLAYRVAKQKMGFTDFKVLDDFHARKKKILEGIKWALTRLDKNDRVYIHLSGHGSFQNVTAQTEGPSHSDGYDQAFVPYDYETSGLLIDAEFNYLLRNTDNIVVVTADACYSGTLVRAMKGCVKNRFMRPSLKHILDGSIDIDSELRPKISRNEPKEERPDHFINDTGDIQNNVILISACGDHQTAADMTFPEVNRAHGALTFYMFQTLAENNWKMTYRDLVTAVVKKLEGLEFTQIPQLECRAQWFDKNFLQ